MGEGHFGRVRTVRLLYFSWLPETTSHQLPQMTVSFGVSKDSGPKPIQRLDEGMQG